MKSLAFCEYLLLQKGKFREEKKEDNNLKEKEKTTHQTDFS